MTWKNGAVWAVPDLIFMIPEGCSKFHASQLLVPLTYTVITTRLRQGIGTKQVFQYSSQVFFIHIQLDFNRHTYKIAYNT